MSEEINKLKKERDFIIGFINGYISKIESELIKEKCDNEDVELNLEHLSDLSENLKTVHSKLECLIKTNEINSNLIVVKECFERVNSCKSRALIHISENESVEIFTKSFPINNISSENQIETSREPDTQCYLASRLSTTDRQNVTLKEEVKCYQNCQSGGDENIRMKHLNGEKNRNESSLQQGLIEDNKLIIKEKEILASSYDTSKTLCKLRSVDFSTITEEFTSSNSDQELHKITEENSRKDCVRRCQLVLPEILDDGYSARTRNSYMEKLLTEDYEDKYEDVFKRRLEEENAESTDSMEIEEKKNHHFPYKVDVQENLKSSMKPMCNYEVSFKKEDAVSLNDCYEEPDSMKIKLLVKKSQNHSRRRLADVRRRSFQNSNPVAKEFLWWEEGNPFSLSIENFEKIVPLLGLKLSLFENTIKDKPKPLIEIPHASSEKPKVLREKLNNEKPHEVRKKLKNEKPYSDGEKPKVICEIPIGEKPKVICEISIGEKPDYMVFFDIKEKPPDLFIESVHASLNKLHLCDHVSKYDILKMTTFIDRFIKDVKFEPPDFFILFLYFCAYSDDFQRKSSDNSVPEVLLQWLP